ncbi:tape measure protein [Bradyrhizobium sp. BWC-3-1]|uniref:tape measure protein n=1 Tax=Bradyrhizobium sp. BWC-3-1 TaxID=3080012 RepID=UPI00293F61BE|nr:tape measure protein [Bradyrhizobium sp. BWC-3-1]WOH55049.1 tape measure protein [Bradyrhizobium sp. BWC-3-1]
MSDPTLGFSVDTSGLEKGNQALDQTLDKSKKVEDQANKTSDALGKMGSKSGDGLSKTAQSADQLAASLVKASSEAQKHLNVSQSLDTIVAKTGASYTQANAALTAAISGHKNAADATSSHGRALDALAGAAGGVVPPINSIAQAAAASGSSLGGLTSAISGGTLAIGGIAAAAVSAAIELAKTGDELNRQKERFSAITGSAKAGAESLDLIKRTANTTGVEFSSLAAATERAVQGIGKMNTSWPVIKVDTDDAKRVEDVLGTLAKVMQSTGANAREEGQVFGALGDSIQKTGGLTADTFQRIRDALPQVARAIASAFGVTDLNAFQKVLATHPKSFQDLEDAIKRIKPAIDAAFDPNKPKTFEQGIRGLSIQWNQFLEDLAKTGAFDVAKDALAAMGKTLKSDLQDALALVSALNSVSSAAANAASNIASVAAGKGQGGSDNTQYDAMGNVTSSAGGPSADSAYSFDNSDYLAGLAGYATGGSFTVGGSGGTDSQLIQFMATPGEKVSIDTPGASSAGQTLGSLMPSDSTNPAAGSNVISAGFADDLKTQTAALSDRINASTSSITSAVNASAATITASLKTVTGPSASPSSSIAATSSAGGVTPLSPSISGGGGGAAGGGLSVEPENSSFSTRQKPKTDTSQNAAPTISAQQALALAQLGSGVSRGQAAGVRGYQGEVPVIGDTFKNPLNPLDARPQINPPSTVPVNPQSMAPVQTAPSVPPAQSTYYNDHPYPAPPIADPFAAAKQYMGGPSSPVFPPIPPIGNPMGDFDPGSAFKIGKGSDDGVKQQTDQLKNAQSQGSKTVADAVKQDQESQKAVGDKTTSSLGDISKFSFDQLKSLDTVQQSTEDGTDATKADTEATTSGFDDTKSGLGDIQTAATQTTEGVGQATDAVSTGSSNIVDALGNAASSIAEAVSSAVSSASNATSSGASGFGSDISSGSDSFDSGSASGFDFAGAVADGTLPAFASGGQFTVSGSGGTDTEHIEFMATPGEVVTVTPPGGQAPHNPAMGAGPSTKGSIAAYATGGQFTVGLATEGDGFNPVGSKTLGSTLGATGNPGATADLISAHFAEALKEQTASLKDAISANKTAVVSAITSSTSQTIAELKLIEGKVTASSVTSSASSSGSGAGTGGGKTSSGGMTPYISDMIQRYGLPQNPAIGALLQGPGYVASYPGANPADAWRARQQMAGFAEGGSFTVGGSGGTDTQVVKFKATPGEIVSITPPGNASQGDNSIAPLIPLHNDNIPGASFAPTLSMTPQASSAVVGRVVPHGDPSANPAQGARNVNIYVQQGVQADQFIRSRAEMQRAMR